jgi:signal peptidase I
MIPTLLIGDFILVNKYAYGLRLPVTNTKIVPIGEPERGDVVVFRYPVDERVNFIKRLVGLPGDTITYRNKQLFINGEVVALEAAGNYSTSDVKCSTPRANAFRFTEQLGDVSHEILLHQRENDRAPREWVVPPGHYFVMGDNRDRSNDSREWGFVPESNLMGRAVGIWLNFDYKKGCGDLSRIGDGIH